MWVAGSKVNKGVACTVGARRSTPIRLGRKNAEVFRLYSSSVDTDVLPKIELKPRAEGPEGLGKPVLGRPTLKKPDGNGRGRGGGRGRGCRGGGRGGGRDTEGVNGNGSSTMPKLKLASEVKEEEEEENNRRGNGRAGPGPSPAAAAIGRPNLGRPAKKRGPGGGPTNMDEGNRSEERRVGKERRYRW